MCRFISGFILAILIAGTQSFNRNPNQTVYSVDDKNLRYFDILEVIVDGDVNKTGKTIVVRINEKILSVVPSDNSIAFTLESVRPTTNGNISRIHAFENEVYTLKTSELPHFDILNITINKANGVRSEKVIKIFVGDKIVGMDTRNQTIDLYLKKKSDENTENFLAHYPVRDIDGDRGAISYSKSGPHGSVTSISTKKVGGNSGNIGKSNGFIILCFILWHLTSQNQ